VRLTLFYTVAFGVFLIAFSLALYFSFDQRIQADLDNDTTDHGAHQILVVESLDRLQHSIKWIDLASLLIIGYFSWYVAGKSLEPIKQSVKSRERFMADASHELRTPLTVLQTGLEVFERKKSPTIQEAHKLAKDSLEEVQRMDQLVFDLRTLARLDSAPIARHNHPSDLAVSLKRSLESLSSYAVQQGITIDLSPLESVPVAADPYQLEQICNNLLRNAIDYSPEGSVVTGAIMKGTQHATLTVKDAGIGIAKEDQLHVFDRFWRSESSRSRKTGGSGLGLSIVKDLVCGMGGSISVTSKLGEGSCFTVRLPLVRHSRSVHGE
jgi:two-component system sensor histidine kinase CiaH